MTRLEEMLMRAGVNKPTTSEVTAAGGPNRKSRRRMAAEARLGPVKPLEATVVVETPVEPEPFEVRRLQGGVKHVRCGPASRLRDGAEV